MSAVTQYRNRAFLTYLKPKQQATPPCSTERATVYFQSAGSICMYLNQFFKLSQLTWYPAYLKEK